MSKPIFIIAEAGVNHNGSLDLAKKLIDKALWAGADAVKFQSFKANSLMTESAPKAAYQKINTGEESQFDMIKRLELDYDSHILLKEYADKKGIEFMSTPFDHESIDLLSEIGVKRFKVGSGDLTNLPYLRHMAGKSIPIILSTGMSDMEEIKSVVSALKNTGFPQSLITILHATTEYPAPVNEVNLKAMQSMSKELGIEIGYSDHTQGIEVPIAAAALGATVIEKHFTLDRNMDGPDHKASLEPQELKEMVEAIRKVELSLGDGIKVPTLSESKNKTAARKSLIAAKSIVKGEVFTEENLCVKRPGSGISPMKWDEFIGKPSQKNYDKDELI